MVYKGLIKGSVNWKVENGIDEVVQQQQLLTQALTQSSAERLSQSFQNLLLQQNQQGIQNILNHQNNQQNTTTNNNNNNNNNVINNQFIPGQNPQSSLSNGNLGNLVDFETPAVENPEECVLWYYNYFLGKSHQNYLGTDDSGSVFGASIIKEESSYGDISYKTIVWTGDGIERQLIQLKQKQSSLTPSEIIKRTAPKLIIKKIKEVESPDILQDFKDLESSQTELNYKFGVLLGKPNQNTEDQFYNNQVGSEKWDEFLNLMGDKVELRSFKGYRGGLDVVNNTTGTHSLYTKHKGYDIMFHVSTMLPFTPGDTQQIERKRHIGNDIVIIIFYDTNDHESNEIQELWDPSTVNSNFNHIFAVVKPEGENYQLEFAVKNSIARFGPKLPNPSIFAKNEAFKDFFITKLVNSQRAALQSAPSFTSKLKRTFKAQLENIYQKHNITSTSASITSFVTKRRSNSISHINKGKELKAKDQIKYSSSFIKPHKSHIFETEILFSKNLTEKIVCLDVIESDEIRATLIVATEESIYLLKSNMITNESIFQKVISLKDCSRITVIKPLNILLVLTPKGLFYYEMDSIMNCFKINQQQHSSSSSSNSSNNNNTGSNSSSSSSSSTPQPISPSTSPPVQSSLVQQQHNQTSPLSSFKSNMLSSSSSGGGSSNNLILEEPKSKSIPGTKGCSVYGYTKADAQNTNETDITLLYVALKKTLYLFEWNKGEFHKNRDLPVSENIKTLCPVAPGMICIGLAKEFLLVDIFTQTIKELYKKPNSEPVKALSLENEILLCFNNIGIFVDEKGNKTRSYELKWGSTPSSLALVPSYILGISGPLIEVRSLLNGNIIQSLPSNISSIVDEACNNGININLNNNFGSIDSNNSGDNNSGASGSLNGSGSIFKDDDKDHDVDNCNSSNSTFSTFNDLAHVDNGNIFVASSSKGISCIIRIKQNISNHIFSPPSSPSVLVTTPLKDLSHLNSNDLSK